MKQEQKDAYTFLLNRTIKAGTAMKVALLNGRTPPSQLVSLWDVYSLSCDELLQLKAALLHKHLFSLRSDTRPLGRAHD